MCGDWKGCREAENRERAAEERWDEDAGGIGGEGEGAEEGAGGRCEGY